jgi:hypothetical protein
MSTKQWGNGDYQVQIIETSPVLPFQQRSRSKLNSKFRLENPTLNSSGLQYRPQIIRAMSEVPNIVVK